MKLFIFFLLVAAECFAQNGQRQILLDSLNKERASKEGLFNLYIKKTEVEVISGLFRGRTGNLEGFVPFNFTANIYLPFQYDLNYVHLNAHEKLFKINVVIVVNASKYGSYAVGTGSRFSFLIFKKAYLSYQLGVVWCEPEGAKLRDGINYRGLCFHHEFSFTYSVSKHIKVSANILHISNGNIFKARNNQDALGIGVGYVF